MTEMYCDDLSLTVRECRALLHALGRGGEAHPDALRAAVAKLVKHEPKALTHEEALDRHMEREIQRSEHPVRQLLADALARTRELRDEIQRLGADVAQAEMPFQGEDPHADQ